MRLRCTLILLLTAAACGRSTDDAGCAAGADCPAGKRCAAAPGGGCVADPAADAGADRGGGADGGQPAADGGADGGATDGGAIDGGSGALDGGADGGVGGGVDGGGLDGGGPPTPSCAPACAASQVCTAALTCADAYRLTILTPAPNEVVAGFVKVQARVERGAPGAPLPSAVELRNSFNTSTLPMKAVSSVGLATVYSFDYWAPERTEAPLTLTVAAVAPWGELRQEVTVQVDSLAPRQLQGVSMTCDTGECNPGSVIVIRQQLSDAHLLSASAAIDLDGYARSFPFVASGGSYVATIPLREFPFPFYSKGVTVRFTARDTMGNEDVATLWARVERLLWRSQFLSPPTTPAVMKDGTLVVGLSRSAFQLVGLDQGGNEKWRVHLAVSSDADGGHVTAPPSVGASAIWAGSEDGRVYAVDLAGTRVLNGVEGGRGCDTGGAIRNTPSVGWQSPEVAFAGSSTGSGFGMDAAIKCVPTGPTGPLDSGTAIDAVGRVFAWSTTGQLHRYVFGTTKFTEQLASTIGAGGVAPLALTDSSRVAAAGLDGQMNLSDSIPAPNVIAFTAPISSSPVIAANGDVIFGDDAGVLHRYSPGGVRVWALEPNLGSAVNAPMLLAGGDVEILVPTAGGKLFGLKGDGTVVWSTDLAPGKDLHEGNLFTPPGQVGRVFSTAYFGCADGNLYAVMVDGQLDAASPWPRAHHDPQNTGNVRGPRP